MHPDFHPTLPVLVKERGKSTVSGDNSGGVILSLTSALWATTRRTIWQIVLISAGPTAVPVGKDITRCVNRFVSGNNMPA